MMSDAIAKVRNALQGISGVPVTSYAKDGQADTSELSTLIKCLADAGVQHIMAADNTGEFFYPNDE